VKKCKRRVAEVGFVVSYKQNWAMDSGEKNRRGQRKIGWTGSPPSPCWMGTGRMGVSSTGVGATGIMEMSMFERFPSK
jgi:hypothetical protein